MVPPPPPNLELEYLYCGWVHYGLCFVVSLLFFLCLESYNFNSGSHIVGIIMLVWVYEFSNNVFALPVKYRFDEGLVQTIYTS